MAKSSVETDLAALLSVGAVELEANVGNKKSKKFASNLIQDSLFQKQLAASMDKVFSRHTAKINPFKPKKKKATERVVNVMLSDLHFQSLLNPKTVMTPYGAAEEARSIAGIAVQIADYKPQYRDETELYIHALGDWIQNQLHDARDGAPLAHQFAATVHYIVQLLEFLSQQYKKITMSCTPGNHGRNKARHQERATLDKWDSIENMIYYAIKAAVRHLPNVTVKIPYTPFYTYEVFGMYGFMTHGDTVINIGFPDRTINVAGVSKQINEINSSLEPSKRYVLFGCGHVHIGSTVHLSSGAQLITNAALIPSDQFAVSIGKLYNTCGQQIWESAPEHMLGDNRLMKVTDAIRNDKSLEKIIAPFEDFND